MSGEFLRQLSLINQKKLSELRVAIIGTGSIGSFTALALTKMGVQRLTLWDKDLVELHNVSNQLFSKESLQSPKVTATMQECKRYSPVETDIECLNEFYEGQALDRFDIVISLVDNIEGRKSAFEASLKSEQCQLFIDARMGAELLRTFVFNPRDSPKSEEYLKDYIDGVTNEELPCTARTIIYNVLFAASIITSFVKKHINGEAMPFQFVFNFGDYSQMKSKS